MIKYILNEELGISNSVSLLTLKIKNFVSNDYSQNFNNASLKINYEIVKNRYVKLHKNSLDIKFLEI